MKALNKTRTMYPYYYRTHENTKSFRFATIEYCELSCAPLNLAAKACYIQQSLDFTLDLPYLFIMSCLYMGLQS